MRIIYVYKLDCVEADTDNAARRRAVVEAVRRGARSRADVQRQVGGYSALVRAAISEAIAADVIHETVAYFPTRGGSARSGRGLAYGPAPAETVTKVKGQALRRRRDRAGLSQRELAARLGVTVGLVNHWEKGRQPVPSRYATSLEEAFTRPASDDRIELHSRRVLQVLRAEGPLPLGRLVRSAGGASTTRAALARLLAANEVHKSVLYVPSRRGQRSCRAFAAGPKPAGQLAPMSTAELRAARRRARWSQAQLAAAIGVSEMAVGRWERDLEEVPEWAAPAVRRTLERLPVADPIGEAQQLIVAKVRRSAAGISRKALARSLDRHDEAFARAIEQALARGLIHEDTTGERGGRRRLHAAAPPPALTGTAMADRRCALGWRQTEFARIVGIKGGLLSGYENGRPIPTVARRRILEALAAGEAGRLPRGSRPLRRRGKPVNRAVSAAYAERVLAGLSQPVPWAEVVHGLRAELVDSPGRHILDGWVRAGRAHVYEELSPKGQGERRTRRRMVAAGPGKEPPTLTGAQLARLRRRAGLSRPQLSKMVGLHETGGRIGVWENGNEPIPAVWAVEFLTTLALHGPSRTPRVDYVRISDEELRALALGFIVDEPGQLSATQLTLRLPGDVRRRWRALAELEEEGRVHQEPLSYRDKTGRRQTKQVFVPGPG